MAEFPALPLWTDAYLGDTHHLTTIEHGAYLLLLITAWRTKDKRLPDDDKLLARYARLTPRQWARVGPVIREFFDAKDGYLYQGRLNDEYNAVKRKSKSQSRKSNARWLKNKKTADAAASSGHSRGNASLTHIDTYSSMSDSESILGESEPSLYIPTTSGADGTEKDFDFVNEIWKQIPWLIDATGLQENAVRSRIGRLLKNHDPPSVLDAIIQAGESQAVEPLEYATKVLHKPDVTDPSYWEAELAKVRQGNK